MLVPENARSRIRGFGCKQTGPELQWPRGHARGNRLIYIACACAVVVESRLRGAWPVSRFGKPLACRPLLLMDMADRPFLMQDGVGHSYPIHAYICVSIMLTPIVCFTRGRDAYIILLLEVSWNRTAARIEMGNAPIKCCKSALANGHVSYNTTKGLGLSLFVLQLVSKLGRS